MFELSFSCDYERLWCRIAQHKMIGPKGSKDPIIRYLGFLGNSNFKTSSGQVYDYWVLGPLGDMLGGRLWEVHSRVY